MKQLLMALLIISAHVAFAKRLDHVKLYIPPVGVGLLMVDAAKDPALKRYAKNIEVVRWNTPDQLRAGMFNGDIDITFVPSYVGANFYNKGIDFRLMNVITGGILQVLSTDKSITSIDDLAGKTIVVPFKNDMPDLVLQAMLKAKGITDQVKIKYVATPSVGVKMALAGQIDNILLPEVAATKVKILAKKKKNITYHRSIDITKAYGEIFDTRAYIPQAGVAVRASFAKDNANFLEALHFAMMRSSETLLKDPKRVIKQTNSIWPKQGQFFAKSIKYWNLGVYSSKQVQDDLEKFYNIMLDLNPAIVGKKIPNDAFYMSF